MYPSQTGFSVNSVSSASGSSSQGFGSTSTALTNPGFGSALNVGPPGFGTTSSAATGFGSSPGTTAGFGQNPGNVFGTSTGSLTFGSFASMQASTSSTSNSDSGFVAGEGFTSGSSGTSGFAVFTGLSRGAATTSTSSSVGSSMFGSSGSVFGAGGQSTSGNASASQSVGGAFVFDKDSKGSGFETKSVFGTGSSSTNTISSKFGTGSSAFGTTAGGGFGGGLSVFGGHVSTSAKSVSTQSNPVSTDRKSGAAMCASVASTRNVESSIFGHKTGSMFSEASNKSQGNPTNIFSQQIPVSTVAASNIASPSSSASTFGLASGCKQFGSGFGSENSTLGSSGFGGVQAASVFGSSQRVSAVSQPQTSISSVSYVGSSSRNPPNNPSSVNTAGHPTTSASSSVFGGNSKLAFTGGNIFGGVNTLMNNEEGAASGAESTGASVFGKVNYPQAKQTLVPSAAIPYVFGGGQQGKTSSSTVLPSSTASVFGGKTDFNTTFGGARQLKDVKTTQTGSVFGGKQTSQSHQQTLFPAATSVSSQNQQTKVHFGNKEQTLEKMAEEKQSTQSAFEVGRGTAGDMNLISKRSDAAHPTIPNVFGGGQREGLSGAAASSSVFGGKPSSSVFPTVSGQLVSQKRSAAEDAEGGRDVKRGRGEEIKQDQGLTRNQLSSGKCTPEKVKLRRSSSVLEDISKKVSIVIKGISANLNKGYILRKHFSRFGNVKLIRPVPAKRQAYIHFETHAAAAEAKDHGRELQGQDGPLSIFWKSSTQEKSPTAAKEPSQERGYPWKRASPSTGEKPKGGGIQLPNSVAEELASMSGASSTAGDMQQYHILDRQSHSKKSSHQSRSPGRKDSNHGARARSLSPSAHAELPSSTASALVKSAKVDAATFANLAKMVATTTMDKVSVLDTRDKFLRHKLGKQTSGGIHSKAFVGTCPDMCPEKERLYREEVRRLSIFEIIPGSSTLTGSTSLVDHTRAVKEYSRSSADQDEPLPHELRPLPVLTMTMNYLLAEIADRGEDGKWAEWYDFLWNRTRSIRKEITQQQLCNQQVVDLLEKCVRFHIYCSERLCTEDMMVFDSKINDENLTKCLQTLKELYADMENKHSMYCPNEAEFRAYMVLMNLNEGDTLREVQQLRREVRASAAIGFSVKAYSSLNSNNYVRFFRLVKTASFLNGCILHRYFNQIRARALQIILRSHTAGLKKVEFSLSELKRLLYFESTDEVKEFSAYYGLLTNGSGLVLDRSAYVEPESSLPCWRAIGLVESKLMVSVGEVINGGILQAVNLPTPQCSFNDQGLFIGNFGNLAESTEVQSKVTPFTVKAQAKPSQLQPSPLQQVHLTQPLTASDPTHAAKQVELKAQSESLRMIARDLFFEIIDEMAQAMALSTIDAEKVIRACESDISAHIISSVTSDMAREVSIEVMEYERTRKNQEAAAERRNRVERVAADLVSEVIDSTMTSQIRLIAQEEIEEAQAEENRLRQEKCTVAVQAELLDEVCGEVLVQVAEEVHQVDVVQRLQLLDDLLKAVELRRTSHWLLLWRQALKIRQRQKRAMLGFPCAPPMQSSAEILQSMYPDRPEHLSPLVPGKSSLLVNSRAQMTLMSPLEIEQRSLALTAHLSLASLVNSLQRARAWQPLNMANLLQAPIAQCLQQWPGYLVRELKQLGVQWKLLISMPGDMELEEDEEEMDEVNMVYKPPHPLPLLKQWLCAKFTHGDSSSDLTSNGTQRNILSQYSTVLSGAVTSPARLRLSVCVRNVPEFSSLEKSKALTSEEGQMITKGTNAILFLLPHADTADDTKWIAAKLRLARVLEAKPVLPATPLVLLLPCASTSPASPQSQTTGITHCLGIEGFQQQGLLTDVAVVELPVCTGQHPEVAVASPLLQAQISEAVKYLASRVPEPPELRCERLADIVEDCLTQHFFTPVLQDLRGRQKLLKLHQAPNCLIGLYNSVVDHIVMALTSPALQEISWPAPELQHLAGTTADWNSKNHLAEVYELVSNLRLPWFHYKDRSAMDWEHVCHDVWTFIRAVVHKRCDSAVTLTTRISRLLAQTCLQFENMCSLMHNEDKCTPTYVNAPWTDIILVCVEFRLEKLHAWKDEEQGVRGDVEVLFEEEDLQHFEPPAAWVQALLDTDNADTHRIEDTMEEAAILQSANRLVVKEDDFADCSSVPVENKNEHSRTEDSQSANIAEKSLLDAARDRSELPSDTRVALNMSETLLLHVEEERQKSQALNWYLQKALHGNPCLDFDLMDVSTIAPVQGTPHVFKTPGLPAKPVFSPETPRLASVLNMHSVSGSCGRSPHLNLFPRRLASGENSGTTYLAEDGQVGRDTDGVRVETHNQSLSEGVEQFKENLQAQRYANELFQKRLESLLES